MYRDILEDSWVVQEERREGAVRGLRDAALNLVKARFPEIYTYAKKHIDLLEDTDALQELVLKMGTSRSEEEALQYLITLAEEEKRTDTGHHETTVSD